MSVGISCLHAKPPSDLLRPLSSGFLVTELSCLGRWVSYLRVCLPSFQILCSISLLINPTSPVHLCPLTPLLRPVPGSDTSQSAFFDCLWASPAQALGQWFSKCHPWTSSISITLELGRNSNPQAPPSPRPSPDLLNQKPWGGAHSLYFNKPSRGL